MKHLMIDYLLNPQNYLSYEKFVKYAIKDSRPSNSLTGMNQLTAVCYPSPNLGRVTVFKIDGGRVHKKMKFAYQMVSPLQLAAYGKTKEEFYDDWKACHEREN